MDENNYGLGLSLSLSLGCSDNRSSSLLNLVPKSFFSDDRISEVVKTETATCLRGIDMNQMPSTANIDEEVGVSSPMSVVSNASIKRREREENEIERTSSSRIISDEDEDGGDPAKKKLRLSKDQSAVLEETFKEHSTLNPKQKMALAKQLNLRPRQVEVWFQNRRARTKLKQTEVDCNYLKRCYENLTEENIRLQKELRQLRASKLSPQMYAHMSPPTTLTICHSCERFSSHSASPTATPMNHHNHHHHHNHLLQTGSVQDHPVPVNPWAKTSMYQTPLRQ